MTKSSDSSLVSVRKSSCAPGGVTREREITQLPSAHGPCRCHPGLPRNKYLVSSWQGTARVGRAACVRRQRCWRRALVPGWGQMCCLLRAGARNCLLGRLERSGGGESGFCGGVLRQESFISPRLYLQQMKVWYHHQCSTVEYNNTSAVSHFF